MTDNAGSGATAWVYDLATRIEYSRDGDRYAGFDKRISFDRPTVSERAIRNLTPLYAIPDAAQARIRKLTTELDQALRQWRMYAEMHEERDLSDEKSPEADLYRAARAALTSSVPKESQ